MKQPKVEKLAGKIAAILLVIVGSFGVWVFMQHQNELYAQEQLRQQEQARQVQERAAQEREAEDQIKALFYTFLEDVKTRVAAYNKERQVLKDLVQPANLRRPDYATQNLEIAQNLIPSLRGKMDELILVFENTDQNVQALSADLQEKKRRTILEGWSKVKQEQASRYIDFFSYEEELIAAYERLLGLYAGSEGRYVVDAEHGSVLFEDPALQQEEAALRADIETLAQKQQAVLNPEAEPTPAP